MCLLGLRLSLLDLQTNWTYKHLWKWNWFIHRGLTVIRCDNLGKGPDIN